MPHISELQDEYSDKGVQVISISDEDLETVEEFLEKKVRGEEEMTYFDLTKNYCLTTDPDRSRAYGVLESGSTGWNPDRVYRWKRHKDRMDRSSAGDRQTAETDCGRRMGSRKVCRQIHSQAASRSCSNENHDKAAGR